MICKSNDPASAIDFEQKIERSIDLSDLLQFKDPEKIDQ